MLPTNKPISLQKTGVCETGLSDCHKMVFIIFVQLLIDLPWKSLNIETIKVLMKTFFCHELDQTLLKSEIHKAEDSYSEFPEIFKESLPKHAPLKSKEVRSNHAPFMKKELSKDFMNKSILRNMYLKWPSRENFLAYKKKKDKCNTLRKKTKKGYFKYFSKNKDFATS